MKQTCIQKQIKIKNNFFLFFVHFTTITLTYNFLSKANIDSALQIAKQIFPNDFSEIQQTYQDSLQNNGLFPIQSFKSEQKLLKIENFPQNFTVYYAVYNQIDILIGITGVFTSNYNKNNAWLGWFGVGIDHRRHGYGKQILIDIIELCKVLGFKQLLLQTLDTDLDVQKLYNKLNFSYQPVNAMIRQSRVVFRSLSLCSDANMQFSGNFDELFAGYQRVQIDKYCSDYQKNCLKE